MIKYFEVIVCVCRALNALSIKAFVAFVGRLPLASRSLKRALFRRLATSAAAQRSLEERVALAHLCAGALVGGAES